MALYPVSLNLKNKLCVVIGAGKVAKRKIKSLLEAGAQVKVVANQDPQVENIQLVKREYQRGDLTEAFLVVAATDNKKTNQSVYDEAVKGGILVNIVDEPKLCNFFVPSVINRGKLQITISTSGFCPALSKKIRKQLEVQFGEEYEDYLQIVEESRRAVISKYPQGERKAKINAILNDKEVMELIKQKRVDEARDRLKTWI